EEFVADGVILLNHMNKTHAQNRKLTIAKMRGTPIDRCSFEYLIGEKYGGIIPIVLPKRASIQNAPTEKLPSGIEGLDKMLHGGVFKGSVTLIEGASGIGKTLTCLQFLGANALKGEKTLYISLEEPIGQIERTMRGIGLDPQKLRDNLFIDSYVPEALSPLHYYMLLKDLLDLHHPTIIAFDTVTAMEHLLSKKDFINFSRYLQLLSKQKGITVLLTSTYGTIEAVRSSEISTMADNIVILRYFEIKDRMGREMLVLKTRGSEHEKKTVLFEITGSGINVQS
ncbi:MAG TPA: ATPase domain-containing protein, partial [Candidatus Bathyarchaeia archaeon]|nr:ATPase domain-containing protein [Candidatus Bathyarchaeia archaeon]